jgi:hypothetical protein
MLRHAFLAAVDSSRDLSHSPCSKGTDWGGGGGAGRLLWKSNLREMWVKSMHETEGCPWTSCNLSKFSADFEKKIYAIQNVNKKEIYQITSIPYEMQTN